MYSREVFWKQTKKTRAAKCKPLSFLLFYWTRSEGFEPPADVVPETTALSN